MFEVTFLSTTQVPNLHNVFCAFLIATGVALGTASPTEAQTATTAAVTDAMLTLPDAPEATSSSASAPLAQMQAAAPYASTGIAQNPQFNPLRRIVPPGAQPSPLTVGDKILYGFHNSITPFSTAGWVVSAGYSQLRNSSPNYGTNGKAFAQRLGATAARNVSESVFSYSIMAPIFHEDPRYYVMDRGHPIVKRTFYALTRALITRTDSGQATPNFALISGNLA
jgi:hypothetical protein